MLRKWRMADLACVQGANIVSTKEAFGSDIVLKVGSAAAGWRCQELRD